MFSSSNSGTFSSMVAMNVILQDYLGVDSQQGLDVVGDEMEYFTVDSDC